MNESYHKRKNTLKALTYWQRNSWVLSMANSKLSLKSHSRSLVQ